MKRKLVKQGGSALTVCLPAKWVRQHNLQPGDEIEVEEEKDRVSILGAKLPQKESEINIDVSNSGVMLNRIVAAIYKAGLDKANITYNGAKELDVIQNTVYRSCHVYEIMNIRKNVVEIKSISQLDESQFDKVLRKMVHAITTISKETYEAFMKNDFDALPDLILKDRIVDRHTDFCRRLLNKGYRIEKGNSFPLYVVVEQTEIAADIFKIIIKEVMNNKKRLGKELLDFFNMINLLMEHLYDVFFDFNIEKIKKLGETEIKIRQEIDILCEKEKKNVKILAYLINLFETLFEMKSAVLTYHIDGLK